MEINDKKGFTLIELLVVVTIIVILLALLTPAIDRAIQQAERVKCAAQLHVTDAAMKQYAFESKKKYPPPVVDGHWPDGGMSTQGLTTSPPPYPPAGQMVLFRDGFVRTPELFYCPSNPGFFVKQETHFRADNDADTFQYQSTFIHYPYFAAGFTSTGGVPENDPQKDIRRFTAKSFRDPGSRVVFTDVIAVDLTYQSSSHVASEQSSGTDAEGEAYVGAPLGGNVQYNDSSTAWLNFSETRIRLLHGAGPRWFFF